MGGGGVSGAGDIEARLVAAALLWVATVVLMGGVRMTEGSTWCIAKSGASPTSLQTALDYACGAGADCQAIQQSGLCYLPNTVQAHSSYAFNSYYQRRNAGPGTCEFAGTATVTITDPSYGSCTYSSSASTAGGTTTTPSTTPSSNVPPGTNTTPTSPNFGGGIGGVTPGVGGGLTPGVGGGLTPPVIGGTTPGLGGFPPGLGPTTPDISDASPALLLPFFVSSFFCFLQLLF